MKSQYAKPTVTKLGSVTDKTQGGWTYKLFEILSWRGGGGGN